MAGAADSWPSRVRTWLELAGGMAIFGSATPVSKIVTDSFPVFTGAAMRMLVATAILLPWVMARRHERQAVLQAGKKDWLVLGAIALFGMFGFTVLMLFGMKMVSGVVGSIVMSTTPAITAVGAFLFLKESIGWRKGVGIGLSVAGLLVLHAGSIGEAGQLRAEMIWGSLLVLGAVCCEAAYTLLGRVATEKLSAIAIAGVTAAGSLVLFGVPAAIASAGVDWAGVPWRAWAAAAWWGAGTLALGSVLWYRGVAKVRGSTAAGFMGIMPISALVLSYVLLGEQFQWSHAAGFAVVFGGVALIAWAHARSAKE